MDPKTKVERIVRHMHEGRTEAVGENIGNLIAEADVELHRDLRGALSRVHPGNDYERGYQRAVLDILASAEARKFADLLQAFAELGRKLGYDVR